MPTRKRGHFALSKTDDIILIMAVEYNYDWNQGEDFVFSIVYKAGLAGAEQTVDLTNYSLRMDIAAPNNQIITVLNSRNIVDTDNDAPGDQGDSTYEVTLTNAGGISIFLSRNLTLASGPLYQFINASSNSVTCNYDIFLRDLSTNRQTKILYGKINVIKSVTKWL